MTDRQPSVEIRRAGPGDVGRLASWVVTDPVASVTGERLLSELETANYRPEWSWIAESEGRMVGRALWWGSSDADRPATLDCLSVSPGPYAVEDVGADLVEAGMSAFGADAALEFNVDVVSQAWADDPTTAAAVRWRHEAARRGGFTRTTERISFARAATVPRPLRSTRLEFIGADDSAFRAMFAGVAAGSLDSHTNEMVARDGIDALADDDLEFYLSLPGKRDSWRIARLPGGEDVGFIVPTRTAYDASISYLGVLPEHRGQGYVHDLLAEMVHMHHDDGEVRIVGTTDLANIPMRDAFTRSGFSPTRVRIVHAR